MIASRLGYASPSGAFKAIEAGLRATLREPADALRALELERLDALHHSLWGRAVAGNLFALDRVLAVARRRSALLGLDAPKKIETTLIADVERFAERAAAERGLDPALVVLEAERVLAEGGFDHDCTPQAPQAPQKSTPTIGALTREAEAHTQAVEKATRALAGCEPFYEEPAAAFAARRETAEAALDAALARARRAVCGPLEERCDASRTASTKRANAARRTAAARSVG